MTTTISDSERSNLLSPHKDWSSLPPDIISCFARRLVSLKDFHAFEGVCKLWKSEANHAISTNTSLRLLLYKVPILFFPKEIEAPLRDIYNLMECQISQLDLPETKGNRCYSSLGWLLLATECEDDDYKFGLLNPLTRARIELPSLPRKMFDLPRLKKFVLSSNPSRASDYGVMILSADDMVFHKPGYNNGMWIQLRLSSRRRSKLVLMDGVYHDGQFYVVDFFGNVYICKIEDSNDPHMRLKLVVPEFPPPLYQPDARNFIAHYLVEFEGTLLVVLVLFDESTTTGFIVKKVPIDTDKSWEKSQEVKTLGNKTLFVGANTSSFWIEPLENSGCHVNCIYFVNTWIIEEEGDIDVGMYRMTEEKLERFQEPLPCFKFLRSHSWLQVSF